MKRSRVTSSFLRTSVVLCWATTVVSQSPACTLECEKNAPCTFTSAQDAADFASFPIEKSVNGMHCLCPHGWTGLVCEVEFEECDGNHPCLHGGSCVPGLLDDFGNDQLFCNCENAIDGNGIQYVGKFCETSQSSTEELCDDLGSFFCVNGGTCNPRFPASGEPCICPSQYFGEHCEYERGTVPEIDCNLPCKNGGSCVLGEMPVDQLLDSALQYQEQLSDVDHMYCSCPAAFDGEFCEYERQPCGNGYCFHGGTCIERQVNGETVHHCDCSTSTEDAAYAGKFCQFKATSYCTRNVDLNGHLFCVNGGTCRDNPKEGCDCDDRYAGFSCEFIKEESLVEDYSPGNSDTEGLDEPAEFVSDPTDSYICDLECQNDGVCRNGLKDLGYLGDITENAPHLNQTHDQFMHCVCPDGFVGVYCEELVQECGQGEHLCLHGSTCVNDGDSHACDCSTSTSTIAESFAGDHCEHPVTDICMMNTPRVGQPLLFCVNGGVCIDRVPAGNPHPGCHCEDGFYGPHCEASRNNRPQTVVTPSGPTQPTTTPSGGISAGSTTPTKSKSGVSSFGMFVAIMSLIVFLAMCIFFVWGYVRNKKVQNDTLTNNLRWASTYRDDPSNELNIAPRRKSSFMDNYSSANDLASSTDPFATNLAPDQVNGDTEEAEPEVYIGPPRDEDGHELHNVEIL